MPIITAGDKNVDQVQFEFCPLWDGFVKVAVFFQQKEALSYSMIGADNICDIPNSIMALTGKIYISVTGVNANNQTRTSNILSYNIDEGIVDAVAPEDFPGTEEEAQEFYNNILAMCADMQALYKDSLENMAYVRPKDANEFEYDESKLEAKVRAYTYPKTELYNLQEIDHKFSNVYTAEQIENKLGNVYTKDQTYSKSEVYSKSETYAKSEVYAKGDFAKVTVINEGGGQEGFTLPSGFTVDNCFLISAKHWHGEANNLEEINFTDHNGLATDTDGIDVFFSYYSDAWNGAIIINDIGGYYHKIELLFVKI
jgi:hypothetical protein